MAFPERRNSAGLPKMRARWRALLCAALLASGGCGENIQHEKPNILLITLDTTRADRLGCYGYEPDTSPNLDKLAEASAVYENAFSTSSWTLPAHASLFTGKFTSSHGARGDPKGPLRLLDALKKKKSDWHRYRARGLSKDQQTLAQLLGQAGYATAGIVGGPWMKSIFGLGAGFEDYDDNEISTLNGRLAEQVSDAAIRWLEGHRRENFFLFLNYYDPHFPYNAPEPYRRAFFPENPDLTRDRIRNWRYDGEIRYMDHHFGRVIAALKDMGLYDHTLIVVTSDHGELLGEHELFGHGMGLFHPELHIPLLIKQPEKTAAPQRLDTPVQILDLFPMILEAVGVPVPEGIQGGSPPRVDHPLVAEVYPIPEPKGMGSWRALIDLPYKYLWNSKGDNRLYNLESDRGENHNLLLREQARGREMDAALNAYLDTLPKPGPVAPGGNVDEETAEALRSLGYVK